jgi:hypothetical protein
MSRPFDVPPEQRAEIALALLRRMETHPSDRTEMLCRLVREGFLEPHGKQGKSEGLVGGDEGRSIP